MPATPDTDDLHHRIYVSVVSHGHEKHIIETLRPDCWIAETTRIIPVILSNLPSPELRDYCQRFGINYIENKHQLGFGANNNQVFRHCEQLCGMAGKEYFFTINPDIITDATSILKMADVMESGRLGIAAPDLVSPDGECEDNIRTFPTLMDCALRFLFKSKRSTVDKQGIGKVQQVDWAAGAFIGFRAESFAAVDGFDEGYFMYYEDADICRRARMQGIKSFYIPDVKAIHLAARESRSLFSRQIFWHVKSALKFAATPR